MKWLFVLCLLVILTSGWAHTKTYPRGCIYVNGRCHKECPEGTHGYSTGCGRKLPEASCDQPEPVLEEGDLCDYSACYCDSPTVRDKTTSKCVPLEDCPKKEKQD